MSARSDGQAAPTESLDTLSEALVKRQLALSVGLLIATLVLLVPSQPVEARRSSKVRFRVMTFNVRYDFEDDGANRWHHRVDVVARTIEASEAHLVCIQEDKGDQVADLQKRLDRFVFLGRGRNATGSGERCSILVDRETFRIKDHGDFWLSDTPDVPGSNTWGDRYPRKVTWAHLEPKDDDDEDVLVLNTHFPEGRAAHLRERGAELMHRWIEERLGDRGARKVAVIVAGDFNSDDAETPHAIFTKGQGYRMTDAWHAARPNDPSPGTYGGFRGMRTQSRIDWILVGGPVRVLRAAKIDQEVEGRWPSDHYPVLADVEVR